MNRPTRSQWRGIGVLSILMVGVCLWRVLHIDNKTNQPYTNHEEIKEKVTAFYAQIEQEEIQRKQVDRGNYKSSYKKSGHRKEYKDSNRYHPYRQDEKRDIRRKTRTLVDINAADSAMLTTVWGIGPTFAKRIVAYRNRLGGYARIEQLQEIYGMTEENYNNIAPQITILTPCEAIIDPNTTSLNDMRSHPYLDYYQAKAIVEYRARGNHFYQPSDLLKVNLISEETLGKLDGYLCFEQRDTINR